MPQTVAPRSLRYRLLGLAAIAIAPFAFAAALGIAELVSERRAQTQRTAAELAHALVHSVDAELRRAITALEVLAQASELERGDLAAFHARARLLAEGEPFWLSVSLTGADKRRLFNTAFAFPSLPPAGLIEPESLERVIASGTPAVGRLEFGRGQWGFTVRVPVLREGRVRYVLTAPISPDAIHAVLQRQQIAQDWTVAVYDQRDLRVARSRAHPESVGVPATPSLQRLMQGPQRDGHGAATTVEGDVVHTGYSRRSEFGWSVVVGLPDANVQSAILRQLLLHSAGLLGSCLLALVLASLAARRITGPMNRLREAAQALGRRESAVPALKSGVREIDEVGAELVAACAKLAESEAQRATLLKAAEEALARAEQAGRAKDEFLAVLGHELRNPLAPIVASLQVMELKGDKATEAQRAVIRRQLAQMIRLVDDLLDVSRITRGRIELTKSLVDLNAVVRRAVEATTPTTPAKPVQGEGVPRLSVRLAPAPARVEGDEVRLVQVVSNLLVNAFKFTPPHGQVEVTVRARGERVEVEVADTGRGIEPGFLAQVFELFSQEKPEARSHSGGLGLGLSIVKNLVELHGGQVGVHSDGPGRGSRFTVSLPAAAPAPRPAPAAARAPGHGGKGRRILVVDDNVDAAESLATLLGLHGYEVRTAHLPAEALDALAGFPAEIAILDIGLPGMDGYELARRMRAHPAWTGGRLVALTGFGQASDRQRALDAGFDAHLTKPVDPERLMSVLASLRRLAPEPRGTQELPPPGP